MRKCNDRSELKKNMFAKNYPNKKVRSYNNEKRNRFNGEESKKERKSLLLKRIIVIGLKEKGEISEEETRVDKKRWTQSGETVYKIMERKHEKRVNKRSRQNMKTNWGKRGQKMETKHEDKLEKERTINRDKTSRQIQ